MTQLLLSKYNFNRREFYIDLFSQWGFFKKGIVASDIHPDDLTMAWTAFVSTYMRSSEAWFGAFVVARAKFIENRMNGAMMDLHQASVEDGRRCAVPAECDCPFCYKGVPSISTKKADQDDGPSTALFNATTRLSHRIQRRHQRGSSSEDAQTIYELRQKNEDQQALLARIQQASKRQRSESRTTSSAWICILCSKVPDSFRNKKV
ncbi:hypothetical protein PF008_g8207 [Phytophthora fragariae]|uniref:Uncharacterized protein n=1 Tax=Phytophthora fragariae TaxID=53985 RepID=A0A6G0S191_9STRA|nr:hypothetical protein PF008_g8207 [Phytophthora fragariae]